MTHQEMASKITIEVIGPGCPRDHEGRQCDRQEGEFQHDHRHHKMYLRYLLSGVMMTDVKMNRLRV